MMKQALLLTSLCLVVNTAIAAEVPKDSLFFTPEEVRAVEALTVKVPPNVADNGDIHLGAVFYYGPDDWVLWLQGIRWIPSTDRADLHVIEVKPGLVRLSIAAPGMPGREIVLKPHQTFQLSSATVVEDSGAIAANNSR